MKRFKVPSEHQRLEELKNIVAFVFELFDESDLKEIANRTNLSINTVWRFSHGKFSLKCQFNTIDKLARAVGLKLITRHGVPDLASR